MTDQGNAGGPPQPEAPGQQLPNQEQMATAIQTLTQRIQQLGAAAEAREQRIQLLGVEAEARRLTAAQKARENGCKAMNRMPKYNGEGAFRTFKLEYTMWEKVNQINVIPDEDFKKFALLSAFTGKAADMVRCLGPDQTIFGQLTSKQLGERIAQIFQPEAESAMARVEFAQRKQSAKENIAVYAEQKIALFMLAYPLGQANYPTLLTEFVKGVYNPVVKKRIRIRNPGNINDLRNAAVEIVAIERESYLEGYGDATSLDGLSAVTTFESNNTGQEPMDIDKIGAIKSQQKMIKCWYCNKKGHRRSECRKLQKDKADGKVKGNFGDNKGKSNFKKKEWNDKKSGIKTVETEKQEEDAPQVAFLGPSLDLLDM